MAQTISIKHDAPRAMARLHAQLGTRAPRAAASALNRTAEGAMTAAVRAIQKDVGASSQKTIRRNLSVKKATADKPEAKVIAVSAKIDRIPIYEMGARPRSVTKRRPPIGVSYGPGQKRIPGSFIARLKSGHIGVFKRLLTGRLPIDELSGPSVALVLSRRRIYQQVQAVITERLPREMARAFKFFGEAA